MRTKAFRALSIIACMVMLAGLFAPQAYAGGTPIGNWEGTVADGHRNVVVNLSVKKLQLGDPSGTMRWGTPRTCSLETEYAGMRGSKYTFNISGSNGGWCDLYRDGTLSLQMASSDALTFDLLNKQGANAVDGSLTPSAAKALRATTGRRVTDRKALIVRGVNGASCDANGLAQGSDPKVKPDQDVQNLSVNCDPEGGNVQQVRKGLPQAHVCWTKLEDLEARNADVMVQTDPLEDNPQHCLVRDITPNQMVKALHYRG